MLYGASKFSTGTKVVVKHFYRHEGFDFQTFKNDLAVLLLDTPIKLGPKARTICLPKAPPGHLVGQTVVVAGWGVTSENGTGSPLLRYTTQVVWDLKKCIQGLGGIGFYSPHQICAYKRGSDACQGDSGAPLMFKRANTYEIVGLVSFGDGCNIEGVPGVYTNIEAYITWIHNAIRATDRYDTTASDDEEEETARPQWTHEAGDTLPARTLSGGRPSVVAEACVSMRDKRRRSSTGRYSGRRRSRSEERYAPRAASVSFDDTPSDRPRRSSRESTRDGSSSSGEYEIVELYNEDSAGNRWEDDDKEKTESESDAYPQSQAYMVIAAVMVASAFLGVLMKFAFTPSHSGHSHGLRRIPGRVLVEETDATTPFDATLSTTKINISVIRDLATEPKSSTVAEATVPAPRKTAFTYECRTDACLWQSRLIYDKINQSIGPCEDFYAYVCSNRWYNSELEVQSRPYVVSGPGLLILDIAKFLLQQKMREQSSTNFITQSSMLLRNCIQVRNSSCRRE
ncbi:hypothetical protein HPB50_011044 [Hyalomma asiaticum]|uniref:Uncharacterized protein n=1 Tax=Hyalomma asiaticum TaxID=266040 RepID=A0ACB7RLM2_HYAAI|nr:hypothetical protein HPB50_011044 [Hyalomma asiaticum]